MDRSLDDMIVDRQVRYVTTLIVVKVLSRSC